MRQEDLIIPDKVSENLSKKQNTNKRAESVVQGVEHLMTMCEAMV
jgi:hypothetical protein